MATFNQRDAELLFVGAAATKTTGGIDTLNDGEIGLFTPAGTRLTEANAATSDEFIIVKGRASGEVNYMSGIIKKADIISTSVKAYDAPTEQIDYVGYTGSTGSIEVFNDNLYQMRINLHQTKTSNHGGLYLKHAVYKSDASATQAEIATGLAGSGNMNFSREPDQSILFEAINSATVTAGNAFDNTATITQGSKAFTVASDTDYATGTNLAAGDYVRIGSVGGGTALTDDTYRVVSISGLVVTVDRVIQKASGSYTGNGGTSDIEVIPAATAVAADWGVALTGQALTFTVGKIHNDKVSWDLSLEDFGSTAITNSQAAKLGSGSENQVAEMEWFLQGNEGDFYRMGEPNLFAKRAEASGTYDFLHIVTEEVYKGSIVSGPIRKVFTLAIPSTTPNYAVSATANDITDVIEVLANGAVDGTLDL